MVTILERYGERHGRIVGVVQVDGSRFSDDDGVATERVVERLKQPVRNKCTIIRPPTPEDTEVAMAEMDVFLGTRKHSNILALLTGVPVVAIAYQYKTQGIMEMSGLADHAFTIEQFESGVVLERIDEIIAAPQRYAQRVGVQLAELGRTTTTHFERMLAELRTASGHPTVRST